MCVCVCVCVCVCELCHLCPGLEDSSCDSLCARPGGHRAHPSQALLGLPPQVACILIAVLVCLTLLLGQPTGAPVRTGPLVLPALDLSVLVGSGRLWGELFQALSAFSPFRGTHESSLQFAMCMDSLRNMLKNLKGINKSEF